MLEVGPHSAQLSHMKEVKKSPAVSESQVQCLGQERKFVVELAAVVVVVVDAAVAVADALFLEFLKIKLILINLYPGLRYFIQKELSKLTG